MDHLEQLEAKSVHILREAYREFKSLCMLWSIVNGRSEGGAQPAIVHPNADIYSAGQEIVGLRQHAWFVAYLLIISFRTLERTASFNRQSLLQDRFHIIIYMPAGIGQNLGVQFLRNLARNLGRGQDNGQQRGRFSRRIRQVAKF